MAKKKYDFKFRIIRWAIASSLLLFIPIIGAPNLIFILGMVGYWMIIIGRFFS